MRKSPKTINTCRKKTRKEGENCNENAAVAITSPDSHAKTVEEWSDERFTHFVPDQERDELQDQSGTWSVLLANIPGSWFAIITIHSQSICSMRVIRWWIVPRWLVNWTRTWEELLLKNSCPIIDAKENLAPHSESQKKMTHGVLVMSLHQQQHWFEANLLGWSPQHSGWFCRPFA